MISVYINVIDLYQEIRSFCSAWQYLLAKENFNFRKLKFNLRIFFVEISVWVFFCACNFTFVHHVLCVLPKLSSCQGRHSAPYPALLVSFHVCFVSEYKAVSMEQPVDFLLTEK